MTAEPPRDPAHGDIATNAAMVLAKAAGKKPRDIAEPLLARLKANPDVVDGARVEQRPLRRKDVDVHAQGVEIGADTGHQGGDGEGPHLGQPVGLGLVDPARAVALGDRGADLLEILAGIEAFGDRADRLAQRFLVAQVGRLAEL
ncbi:MAG TPA: hypothetical protein VF949_14840, partial [Reyranella sp.]